MNNPFVQKKSLDELKEEDERLEAEVSVAKKRAILKELKNRGQDWRHLSDNGKQDRSFWTRAVQWLKTH